MVGSGKYFRYDNKLEKVIYTEEAKKIIGDMIDELVELGISIHDKFVDSHQFYSVLKFELDELFREQGFLIEWFDNLNQAMFEHDSEKLKVSINKMAEVSDNFFMEAFQVFGVLAKMKKSF